MSAGHGHAHASPEQLAQLDRSVQVPLLARRLVLGGVALVIAFALAGVVYLAHVVSSAESSSSSAVASSTVRSTVTLVTEDDAQDGDVATVTDPSGRPGAVITAELEDGSIEHLIQVGAPDYERGIAPGDRVLLYEHEAEGQTSYSFAGFDRGLGVGILAAAVAAGLVLVAGWRGVRALVSLIFAGVVLWTLTLPALLAGAAPTLVAGITAALLLVVLLYLTHGLNLRTSVALLGTCSGVALATGLYALSSRGLKLTGVTDEDELGLWGAFPDISLSALVVVAVVITAVGVLNDVTITQASAVWELAGSSSPTSRGGVFASAMRIGRDHLASSVYTVSFVVLGGAFSTYLMIRAYDRPVGEMLSSQAVVAELVLTLIGLASVIAAMPLTTALASWAALAHRPEGEVHER